MIERLHDESVMRITASALRTSSSAQFLAASYKKVAGYYNTLAV